MCNPPRPCLERALARHPHSALCVLPFIHSFIHLLDKHRSSAHHGRDSSPCTGGTKQRASSSRRTQRALGRQTGKSDTVAGKRAGASEQGVTDAAKRSAFPTRTQCFMTLPATSTLDVLDLDGLVLLFLFFSVNNLYLFIQPLMKASLDSTF